LAQREVDKVSRKISQLLELGAATDPSNSDYVASRGMASDRIPTIITTEKSLNDPQTSVRCWVNPREASWTLPQRGAIQKTHGGSVRYLWRNPHRNTFYDEFKVAFTFVSGNILPQSTTPGSTTNTQSVVDPKTQKVSSGSTTGISVPAPGLDNFYAFLELFDQDPLLADGRDNLHIIFHTSPVFPGIVLKGWFEPAGISFSESAEGSWQVNWTCPFEIHKTYPKIRDRAELRRIYGLLAVQ
jgi:hypothetical protein